jgi:pyruvate/2-oxoglutarate/acetoin dehydrogenase E1 component
MSLIVTAEIPQYIPIKYFDALKASMEMLAENPRVIFMGQSVACPGTGMSRTLEGVPKHKLLELPVAEDMQLGMSTGMSLNGYIPVSIYPRINFLLLAMSQLVLHLDKLSVYSRNGFKPRVIIRTCIASNIPMDPGVQHLGDYSEALRRMLLTVRLVTLDDADRIMPEYKKAMEFEGSTILIEHTRLY